MEKLLSQYTLTDIILFIILLGTALKGFLSFTDVVRDKGTSFFNKKYQRPKELEETVTQLTKNVNNLNEKVQLLLQSDRDDIKAFITRQHHYFCYQLKEIDDQSLDCIQKRYNHYKEQGGNSYVEVLIEDLRALPKTLPHAMQKYK